MSTSAAPPAAGGGHRWWRALAARGTLAVGAMLAMLAASLITTSALGIRDVIAADIARETSTEAERIAAGLAGHDPGGERFAALTKGAGLDYAVLTLDDGTILAGAWPDRPPPRDAFHDAGATPVAAEGAAHLAAAVRLAGGRNATLTVGRSLAPANAAAGKGVARGLLAALAFLAIALPANALLADRAAGPLRRLARAVELPGGGEAALKQAGLRRDEIGALARAHLSITRDMAANADALHRLTFDDPATRLPNRASLLGRLAGALQAGRPVGLLKFEVEGLGRVAAGLGRQHGEIALVEAARRLAQAAAEWSRSAGRGRATFLARMSDSGFALLAEDVDAQDAGEIARLALAAFERPLALGEDRVTLALVTGVALAPADGDETDALMRSAAAALADARAAGAGALSFAGAELNRKAYRRLRLENELRRAIEQGEFEIHYQPQIELRTDTVAGAEALLRWRHPIRGLVPPGEFIPVAEETGLIEPLGRHVLAEAARAAADWGRRGMALRVAVNVSPLQFRTPDFAETTLAIIRAAGADPATIELEITESAATGNPDQAARELIPLKQAGVRIAIDDFGTGYSNLATLTQLPFDVLKIDRAFVRDVLDVRGARVVVGTVIGMAANLGVETIAEGVETPEQLAFVGSCGCTFGQGFLFARPMPAPAFEAWYQGRVIAGLRAVSAEAGRAAMGLRRVGRGAG